LTAGLPDVFEAKLVFSNSEDGAEGLQKGPWPPFSDFEHNQVPKGYPADALALRGDEGRGTLR
jgi:hypothetical protein